MKASDLLKSTQQAFVGSNTLGLAEDAVFYSRSTATEIPIRAFVEVREVRGGTAKMLYDETVFSNVTLPVPPKKDDWVVYNGEDFVLDHWKISAGMYVLYTLSFESQRQKRLVHD